MSVWPASTEFDMLERSWKIQTSKIKTSKMKTIKIKMWAGPGEEQLTMLKPAVNYTTWQNTVGYLQSENKGVNIIFWRCLKSCHTPAPSFVLKSPPLWWQTDGRTLQRADRRTASDWARRQADWAHHDLREWDISSIRSGICSNSSGNPQARWSGLNTVSPTSLELSERLEERGDVSKSL